MVVTGKSQSGVRVCHDCYHKDRRPTAPTRGQATKLQPTPGAAEHDGHGPRTDPLQDGGPSAKPVVDVAMRAANYSASNPAKHESCTTNLEAVSSDLADMVVPRHMLRLGALRTQDAGGLVFGAHLAKEPASPAAAGGDRRDSFRSPAASGRERRESLGSAGAGAPVVAAVTARALPADGVASAVREAMVREAQVMRRLSHANVVQVIGLSLEPEVLIVTERLEHGTLRQLLRRMRAPPTEPEASRVTLSPGDLFGAVRQVASAVAWLHSHELVVRAIECSSVAVAERGPLMVRLADIGHARGASARQLGQMWANDASDASQR